MVQFEVLTSGATKGRTGEGDSTSPRRDGRLESTLKTPNTALVTLLIKDGPGALIVRRAGRGASVVLPASRSRARLTLNQSSIALR